MHFSRTDFFSTKRPVGNKGQGDDIGPPAVRKFVGLPLQTLSGRCPLSETLGSEQAYLIHLKSSPVGV